MQRQWRKSARSSAGGPECVEIALDRNGAGVRDSKDRSRGELGFGFAQWSRFVGGAKNGEFDGR
ncbi:DUF397 domain-containing protein [Saccharothrix sp. 6-C]|uniref:Uncharacterized protein DUF397 n=1 Tax=Saccharothrix texasensis TaxID=103734 RepID=A0A3N1HEQ0_9PSEU|nr:MULTISPECIES: DUF397 domain-containing protein [Saccharothrix]QQQ74953.1 DUF397 domain-containing protein [Saccharothrix sp. 6-C]ROP40984.1 uncharacterized protein DUF397 [Saccharothrix texasensis]